MDAILVQMQVGHDDDWTDRGVPEVVTGYDLAPTPAAAGAEWMYDHYPTPIGDDWRLLVWAKVRTRAWRRDRPDAVVTPPLYRAAVADRGAGRSRRRRPKLQPAIAHKTTAELVEVGDVVLLTRSLNNAAARTAGPWYVADRVEPDCVGARVRGIGVTTRRDQATITLNTTVGVIEDLPGSQSVIPVHED
jgi:hypothetical protein